MKRYGFLGIVALGLLGACQSNRSGLQTPEEGYEQHGPSHLICRAEPSDKAWFSSGQKAPLFEGLGNLHYAITTKNPETQRYFDQGLMLAYGFNHAEAARSFFEAIRQDSTCAMAYWGFAYVLGPNYNAGMEPDNYERAYAAVQQALQHTRNATEKERMLINAMAKRYPAQPVADRKPFDIAYSQAMKTVADRFPDDEDIAALYAESLMDLHPWDLWEKNGQPKTWTPEIVGLLEKWLVRKPAHAGLHHFYIHVVEASKTPQRGLKSAEVLGKLAPKAGHLVHMPSHIYIRTGHYHEGSLANERAVVVDTAYLTACHAQGTYPLTLHPHNFHFLAATATLEGNSERALKAAWKVAENTKRKLMYETGWSTLQHYYSIPYYVAVKFRKWDEILAWTATDTVRLAYPTAVRHYARGMAYVGKNQVENAKAELRQLEKLAADPALEAVTIWELNSVATLLQIARRVLSAEILAQESQFPRSIALLKEAVALEDQLNYNEPPDWFFSVRHHLGAVLLKARQWPEAERIYAEDLQELPNNGWALSGLYKAQLAQGKTDLANQTRQRTQLAWRWADKVLFTSAINPVL